MSTLHRSIQRPLHEETLEGDPIPIRALGADLSEPKLEREAAAEPAGLGEIATRGRCGMILQGLAQQSGADTLPGSAETGLDYPTMGWVDDVVATIQASGLALIDHFTLPDAAWWDDFYTPMEQRIAQLHRTYAQDAEALDILDQMSEEPAMHRRYSDHDAYAFFVTRRPGARPTNGWNAYKDKD